MEKQELTCNSTVIARPLLAHVSLYLFSSSERKRKMKIQRKFAEEQRRNWCFLPKVEKEYKFILKNKIILFKNFVYMA